MKEKIDARNSDYVGSIGNAICRLSHLSSGLGEIVDMGEIVYQYSLMSQKWVGWIKRGGNGKDTVLEKVGEFESIP